MRPPVAALRGALVPAGTRPRAAVLLVLALAVSALALGAARADASHFRYGHVAWSKTGATSADLSATQAWRRSWSDGSAPDGMPAVGDIEPCISSVSADDSADTAIAECRVVATNATDDWMVMEGLDPSRPTGNTSDTFANYTYTAPANPSGAGPGVPGPWRPGWSGCCNISDSRNAADESFHVHSGLDLSADTASPRTNLAPIVPVATTGTVSFPIPATYGGTGAVRFRLATPEEACGSGCDAQPDGLTINQSTGLVTWNLDAWRAAHPDDSTTPTDESDPSGLWFSSVMMEAKNGSGTVLSSSQVTFLINVGGSGGSTTNNAPVWTLNTPPAGQEYFVSPGQPLAINLEADDPDATDTVHLDHIGLPTGASLCATAGGACAAPVDANTTNGTFRWTPTAGQVGDHIVTFTAQDNGTPSQQAPPRAFTIHVVDRPSVAIGDVTVAEGGTASFDVSLSAPATGPVTVAYATSDGTATAGSDYTASAAGGQVTFSAGEQTKQVTVPTTDDSLDEDNETFSVTLSGPVGATLGDATGVGTITDNDAPPSVSVGDTTVNEGTGGTTNATFTVTLSAASGRTVSVGGATANGTAIAPGDYTAGSSTVTFAPGDTSETVTVPVVADTLDEPDETFSVVGNPATLNNVTAGDMTGQATIVDDDSPPSLVVEDASTSEGDAGTKNMPFQLTLSAASAKTIEIDYATAPGTASAGDFTGVTGKVVFSAGQTAKTVNVPITGDTLDEPDETFDLDVTTSTPANVAVPDPKARGTIVDDDGPAVSITGGSVTEGGTATFTAALSQASPQGVTVEYVTANGSASAPSDYAAKSGTITFPAGSTTQTVSVATVDDALDEDDETFKVDLANAHRATVAGGGSATGTIVDDDAAPSLALNDVSVTEGSSGTTAATFTAKLSEASARTVTVAYATADGTASSPTDYASASGTLTFTPGDTSETVAVAVTGDTDIEPNETFTLSLSGPANAGVADGQGVGTIVNDDLVKKTEESKRPRIDMSVTGTVLVHLPGSKGFVPLDINDPLPLGAIVDATRGAIKLVVPCDATLDKKCAGGTQSGEFYGGRFQILHVRGNQATPPMYELVLDDAVGFASPKPNGLVKGTKKDPLAVASAARSGKLTKLWGRTTGSFRIRGRYAAATATGARWLVDDTKAGTTRISVAQGKAAVRDFVRRRTRSLSAGKAYVARRGGKR